MTAYHSNNYIWITTCVAILSVFVPLLQSNVLKMSTAVETDKMAALATAANEARGLAMDSIAAAHSGHMGLPLGAAEIGASLYGSQVRICTEHHDDECRQQVMGQTCGSLWRDGYDRLDCLLLTVSLALCFIDAIQPQGPHLDEP